MSVILFPEDDEPRYFHPESAKPQTSANAKFDTPDAPTKTQTHETPTKTHEPPTKTHEPPTKIHGTDYLKTLIDTELSGVVLGTVESEAPSDFRRERDPFVRILQRIARHPISVPVHGGYIPHFLNFQKLLDYAGRLPMIANTDPDILVTYDEIYGKLLANYVVQPLNTSELDKMPSLDLFELATDARLARDDLVFEDSTVDLIARLFVDFSPLPPSTNEREMHYFCELLMTELMKRGFPVFVDGFRQSSLEDTSGTVRDDVDKFGSVVFQMREPDLRENELLTPEELANLEWATLFVGRDPSIETGMWIAVAANRNMHPPLYFPPHSLNWSQSPPQIVANNYDATGKYFLKLSADPNCETVLTCVIPMMPPSGGGEKTLMTFYDWFNWAHPQVQISLEQQKSMDTDEEWKEKTQKFFQHLLVVDGIIVNRSILEEPLQK